MFQRYYDLSPEKKETIYAISTTILFVALIFILAWLLPDQGSEKINQMLEERGYSVADIDFTRTETFSNIFLSSQPIEISEGVSCRYWQLVSFGTFGAFHGVYPYPDGWPKPVSVSITLEPEEYQKLLKEAGNDSVESYIKDKLLTEKPE